MTKALNILPEAVLAPGMLHLSDIPLNSYDKPLPDAAFGPQELLDIWRDMRTIREFETVLNEVKIKGSYRNVAYNHAGPAHLSIGQEAAAVGMAFSLTPDDHIFGSHRSHGEILAKAFSAIRYLSDDELTAIMENYRQGAVLSPVRRHYARNGSDGGGGIRDLARRYFIYGAYAEIFARDTGLNRGLGGSMHAFFPRLASTPTMPSSAAPGPLPQGPPCSRGSTANRASSSQTSVTPRSPAGRCGKGSPLPLWTSTERSGMKPSVAASP